MNASCFSIRQPSLLGIERLSLTLTSLYAITSIPAVCLNSLVLYSIWKNPALHKPSYLLLANLALTDLLYGAIDVPSELLLYFANISRWTSVCYIAAASHLIGYWLSSVSIYILALLSIDRLLAIRLKNRYRSFVTFPRIIAMTVPFWVMCFLFFLISVVTSALPYVEEIVVPSVLLMLLTTITVCYSMAFYLLKKLTSSVSSSSSQQPDNGTNNFDVSKYQRSLFTVLIVLFETLLLYLPYFCASVAHSLTKDNQYDQNSFEITPYKILLISELLIGINSTVNPLLYLWRMQDIRQAVKTTVRRILRQEQNSVEDLQI